MSGENERISYYISVAKKQDGMKNLAPAANGSCETDSSDEAPPPPRRPQMMK